MAPDMNSKFHFPLLPLLLPLAPLAACDRDDCVNDGDCAARSVCVVKAQVQGGANTSRCTPVEALPELVDVDLIEEGVTLVDVALDTAPDARAGTIVMRPLSVIVSRNHGPESGSPQ